MIEDSTLRELFRAESEEHLQRLDDALLRLEKTPADQALLEEAFREAHSLKGAARMLGLNGIQTPAHRLEDELNSARRAAAECRNARAHGGRSCRNSPARARGRRGCASTRRNARPESDRPIGRRPLR